MPSSFEKWPCPRRRKTFKTNYFKERTIFECQLLLSNWRGKVEKLWLKKFSRISNQKRYRKRKNQKINRNILKRYYFFQLKNISGNDGRSERSGEVSARSDLALGSFFFLASQHLRRHLRPRVGPSHRKRLPRPCHPLRGWQNIHLLPGKSQADTITIFTSVNCYVVSFKCSCPPTNYHNLLYRVVPS